MTTGIVKVDKEIMGGTPCFSGTRVPIDTLFDYLAGGYSIDYFVYQFPTVKKEQAVGLLELVKGRTERDSIAGVL